jgi:CRISPR-associated protein (TIGR02584 family)
VKTVKSKSKFVFRAAMKAAKSQSASRVAAKVAKQQAASPATQTKSAGAESEIILLAVTGMSPAILTETVWALAHPAKGSGDEPLIPHRVIVLTTTAGRREIESGLFAPLPRFGDVAAWESLRKALAAEGYELQGRLRFGTTPDDLRVFTTADRASGRTVELDDIRTPADNEAAATFILEQVRGLVEDPDKTVIASLAGGRKTMGALLYACFSLIGRDRDRLTHVLVSEPFDQTRAFFFPGQPGGDLTARDGSPLQPNAARVELADVPFVPLRNLFRRELGRPAGGFMRLVEACRAGVRERLSESIRLTVERSRPEIEANGNRLKLAPREHLLMLFLATRTKNGEPAFAMQKEALDSLNEFREAVRAEAGADDRADWRLTDSLKSKFEDDQDIRRALSSLRDKVQSLGGNAVALGTCLPERGRFSLDMPAGSIIIK